MKTCSLVHRVISFSDLIVEHVDFIVVLIHHTLIALKRIHFVRACNPSTDTERKALSDRYLMSTK